MGSGSDGPLCWNVLCLEPRLVARDVASQALTVMRTVTVGQMLRPLLHLQFPYHSVHELS